MSTGGKIQSIDRAMKVLECFSERNPELKLTEISERLKLNKSTLHGIIKTMKDYGVIEQNSETQEYKLGLKLVELANIVLNNLEIRNIAKPVLEKLVEEVNETVHLGQLEGDKIVYIDKVESHQSIRLFTNIGTLYDAHCTAIGKAILAYKSKEEVINIIPEDIEAHTPYTLTTKTEIIENLKKVRESGYSLDIEENIEGLKCVGAPIYDHKGDVNYSISVSGPISRMTKKNTKFIIKKVLEATMEISKLMGYKK